MISKILLIDDDEQVNDVVSLTLEKEGYSVLSCTSGPSALETARREDLSLILLDLRLGEENGLDIFPRLRDLAPRVPIFIMTAHGDLDSAVEAFKLGANGYLRKPFEHEVFREQIAQALEAFHLKSGMMNVSESTTEDVNKMIVSRDPSMVPVLRKIALAAQVNSNVVVTGESGVGKELVAQSLHLCGPRRTGPFVAFNCAAIPETLLESELFGYSKGAFTDARENKPGLFQRANGGTLFLDEIGDAPLSFQAKLLRVLQEREVTPLGATKAVRVDVRIVAATHRNLENEIAAGKFRQDLFYRLHVLPIQLPALRERPADLVPLASVLASRLAVKLGLSFDGFTTIAQQELENYGWPGNVRELQNRLEYALAIGGGGTLSAQQLFPEQEYAAQTEEPVSGEIEPFVEAKSAFEKNYLMRVLNAARGNVAKAARLASKSRTEVYHLLKKHRLDPEQFKEM